MLPLKNREINPHQITFNFIDHVLTELDERFSAVNKSIINAQLLLHKNFGDLSEEQLLSHSHVFLISHEKENLPSELIRWKHKFVSVHVDQTPQNARDALVQCNPLYYPAFHEILLVFLTIPVGSVPCEQSFQALRRLLTWLRWSMGQEILCGLGLLLIHRNSRFIRSVEEVYNSKTSWRLKTTKSCYNICSL